MDITTLGNQRIDQKTFEQLLKHIKLKVTEEYAFPPEIITCGGATIATLGNFSASVGKLKTRKRFFILIRNRASTTAIRFWSEY